jgi:hypothetical protein
VTVGAIACADGASVGSTPLSGDKTFWSTNTKTTTNSKIINAPKPATMYVKVLFISAFPSFELHAGN